MHTHTATSQRIAIMLIAICSITAAAVAQPRLSMPAVHDWGTVTASNSTVDVQQVSAVIPLVNTGTSPLKIKEVRTSCGCTSAPLDKDSLAPGDTARLSVTLNLPNGNGPIEKYITIFTNEVETKPHILSIKANVQRALQLSSSHIAFPPGVVNTPHTGTITVTSNNAKPVTITFSSDIPTLSIGPAKTFVLNKGESKDVFFTFTPDAVGTYSVKALLTTDLAGYEMIALSGFGTATLNASDPAPTFMKIGD
ncbi:MAG: DUF1573 domain-containing protein [Candidatus Kapabacteria bacterium]|nr:DUF1573 domain-containing protein [Candidatus Kapabacteria bacterium]